jgi:hypothetical protein
LLQALAQACVQPRPLLQRFARLGRHTTQACQLSPRDRNYGSIQNDGGELLRRRTIQHQNPMLGDQTFFTSRIPVEASEARSRASLDIVTLSVFLCRNYEHPVQKGWCIITKRTLTTQSQSTSSPIQLTNGTGSKKKTPHDFISAHPHPHMLQDARPPGSVAGSRVCDARRTAVPPPAWLPCLGAKHLVAVRAGQSTGRVPGDREGRKRVAGVCAVNNKQLASCRSLASWACSARARLGPQKRLSFLPSSSRVGLVSVHRSLLCRLPTPSTRPQPANDDAGGVEGAAK